ncbi:MAG: hypothetical protein IT336_02785, partial [Thermomicrobiales bacterium]|nr:hypothetical protein [Thermomicrobiales bacterium]
MSSSDRGVYRGEALRAVAMPLGGLGTGTIALAGDGSLRQWQIHNQVNHLGCVPHSFFAIWARGHRPPAPTVARVLQTAALHGHEGVTPPPTSNDHEVPEAHRELLRALPGVDGIEYHGRYPIATLHYLDDELPLRVSLEAFNPFVPLDPDDSGIPAISFAFTIVNPTERVLLASIAGTLQNAVGWDGIAPIAGVACQQYGGNLNAVTRLDGQTVISMSNAWLKPLDPGNGSMALAVDAPDATYLSGWNDLGAFWDDFAADGRLSNGGDPGPTSPGRTVNGALAVPMKLQPGETRTVRFTLAWHFPNRTVNWSQKPFFGFTDERTTFWLGNRYTTRFGSALDVVAHTGREYDRLASLTRLSRDTFYDTTLPFNLIDTVTAQM